MPPPTFDAGAPVFCLAILVILAGAAIILVGEPMFFIGAPVFCAKFCIILVGEPMFLVGAPTFFVGEPTFCVARAKLFAKIAIIFVCGSFF